MDPLRVTERPPRPRGPVICGSQGSMLRSPLPDLSAFDRVNAGHERFFEVRESPTVRPARFFSLLELFLIRCLVP